MIHPTTLFLLLRPLYKILTLFQLVRPLYQTAPNRNRAALVPRPHAAATAVKERQPQAPDSGLDIEFNMGGLKNQNKVLVYIVVLVTR